MIFSFSICARAAAATIYAFAMFFRRAMMILLWYRHAITPFLRRKRYIYKRYIIFTLPLYFLYFSWYYDMILLFRRARRFRRDAHAATRIIFMPSFMRAAQELFVFAGATPRRFRLFCARYFSRCRGAGAPYTFCDNALLPPPPPAAAAIPFDIRRASSSLLWALFRLEI